MFVQWQVLPFDEIDLLDRHRLACEKDHHAQPVGVIRIAGQIVRRMLDGRDARALDVGERLDRADRGQILDQVVPRVIDVRIDLVRGRGLATAACDCAD